MFSRMHLFNVNILFNLNKDLIFVNSVSLLHMYRLHHPRYLDKLCKKKAPSDWNISVRICSTIFTPLDKLFCIFIASTTAHSWPSPTLSDRTMYILCDACLQELPFTIFNKQNIQFLGPDPQQQQWPTSRRRAWGSGWFEMYQLAPLEGERSEEVSLL